MRSKNPELMNKIIAYIDNHYSLNSTAPTFREIAKALHISEPCVSKYIAEMKEKGMIESDGGWRGLKTKSMEKYSREDIEYVPLVGTIACGPKMLAEENIVRYMPIPRGLLGNGEHFALTACGDSMVNVGIDDGDCVFVRIQNSAEEGQIVVARIDNEATLKRYYLDRKRKQVRLHPENDNMEDMFFDKINIQGVAVKVMKDLF